MGPTGDGGMKGWMVGGSSLLVHGLSSCDVAWLLEESGGKGGGKGGGVLGDCMPREGVADKEGMGVVWLLKESGGKGGGKGGGVPGDCIGVGGKEGMGVTGKEGVGVTGKKGGAVVGTPIGIGCTYCMEVLLGVLVLSTRRETLGAAAKGVVGPVAWQLTSMLVTAEGWGGSIES